MVRQQQSGQQVLALEPGERCKTDMGYQGSAQLLSAGLVCWRRPQKDPLTDQRMQLGCQLLSNTVINLGVTETVITPCYCDYCDYCYFFK